ncbi:heme exporter protein CcmD [Motilimonas pumila]|uniref:Heme exporter protein D n=1 Tax=Motilimonas pumila TaxID=2303987 RepID=A0A418YGS9_9GAMM|nr:heme exporter protein CcmD [Motilimonas pumila]RJG49050.1 heme exporter protein CcmD [Motilimonas pumila]
MEFNSIADFLDMGGYAFYVWLSFGVSFFALIALLASSLRTQKKIKQTVQARAARDERVKAASQLENTL